MIVKYRKKFLKDLSKIPEKNRTVIEYFVFDELPKTKLQNTKIEKMTGYKDYYKVRFGNYRIGIQINDIEIILERVLHRKEIYRYFP